MENSAVKVIVRPSRIHGFGLFAAEEFMPSDLVYKISIKDLSSSPLPRYARFEDKCGTKYIFDDLLQWVNHSCVPNCKLYVEEQGYFIRALESIVRGEEIVVDYIKTELPDKIIRCNCGEPNCRGSFWISE